jgi:hypothetical protein
VQKETSSSITLKVNLTMTLDVSFILMFTFNFIWRLLLIFLKARFDNMKKQRKKPQITSLKCKLIYIETLYK